MSFSKKAQAGQYSASERREESSYRAKGYCEPVEPEEHAITLNTTESQEISLSTAQRNTKSSIGRRAVAYPAAFFSIVGIQTLLLGMNFYLQDVYGATGGQIGSFYAARSLLYIVGCFVARPLTTAIRPQYLLIASPVSTGVLCLAITCSDSLVPAFVLFFLTGISNSLFWPTLVAWLSSNLEGGQLSKTMNEFNASWTVGAIVSPFLASQLSEAGTALPIHAASAMMLFTAVFVLVGTVALPKICDGRHVATAEPKTKVETDESTVLRYAGWIGVFSAFLAFGVLANIFPKFARTDLHMSKSTIGVVFSLRSLSTALAFLALGRTVFWHHRGSQMLVGQFCIIAVLLAMVYARGVVTIGVILAVAGATIALSYSNGLFHGLAGSRSRAARIAVHEAFLQVGSVGGSFFGGLIYQYYSIVASYLCCAAVAFVGLIAQGAITIWARRTTPGAGLTT